MNKFPKVEILIFLCSIGYGLYMANKIDDFIFQTVVIEACVIPISSLVITLLIEFVKLIIKRKRYEIGDSIKTFRYCFFIIFSLALMSNTLEHIRSRNSSRSNHDQHTYKREVLNSTDEPIQKVGKHRDEFLNDNNLYENYRHNFSIKFPKNFDVDYGIGKDSEVQASISQTGHIITVSVAPSGTEKFFSPNADKNVVSDTMVVGMYGMLTESQNLANFVKSMEERGLSDVRIEGVRLTNYNKRKFIEITYKGNAILDDHKHPVVIIGYITHYNHHVYNFYFRSWENQMDNEWINDIKNTMSFVFVDEKIRDFR